MNRRALVALAAVDVVIVAVIAHRYGSSGAAGTAAALVLAPLAVVVTAWAGSRIAGPGFGIFTAAVYCALPVLAAEYMLSTYRATFLHDALPYLVGLRGTGWFALGIALMLGLAAGPRTAVAVAGAVLALWAVLHYDIGALHQIRLGLHETAWSIALAEWCLVAGLLGAAWRSWRIALGLGGILVAAILRAAGYGYSDAAFWKHLGVAMPATALLLSSIVLLVPRLRLRQAAATRAQ